MGAERRQSAKKSWNKILPEAPLIEKERICDWQEAEDTESIERPADLRIVDNNIRHQQERRSLPAEEL